MAETKNTFIKSKMNQDLDQRLVPNGEYRKAFNISISQAEGADVGTLETVLGNVLVTDLGLSATCNAEIIGHYVDDQNKTIYLFVTNFVDTSSDKVSNYPPASVLCQIWKRNIETNINTKLVEGKFLNFSLTHPITGINLIEDLLFWTDNRNQPRKINVSAANPNNLTSPTYYTNDDQINVAKYYPHEPINLIKNYIVDYRFLLQGTGYLPYVGEIVPTTSFTGTGLTVKIIAANAVTGALEQIEIINQGQGYRNNDVVTIAPKIGDARIKITVEEVSTMKDTCTEKLPVNDELTYIGDITAGTPFTVTIPAGTPDYTGALVKITAGGLDATPYLARVISQSATQLNIGWANRAGAPMTSAVYYPSEVTSVQKIELGINPDYDAKWPGDCQFLKDKFVRFAYRFKFDDNEYSLISPFTQPCFIPKQNGYFLSEDRAGTPVLDTEKAYEDTDNAIMENMVTNIDLQIPCPEFLDELIDVKFKNLTQQLHVKEIEIIYKDDAENSLKVLDTITAESFSNLNYGTLIYTYQSRQPKKTLPSSEITRVSDKVPIRALAQEVTGNRVIYGNYVDGYTAMNTLNYEVSAVEKPEDTSLKKEYPNHTLKQNRTYQVGIVLVDRYGRNSDVILSSLDSSSSTALSNVNFVGSTIFHPFYSSDPGLIGSVTAPGTTTWNGDSLRVKFNSQIPLTISQPGYPGLFLGYADSDISNLAGGSGYFGPYSNLSTSGGSGTGLTVNITTRPAVIGAPGLPIGDITAVSINNPGSGYKQGDIITITGGSPFSYATFVYNPNSQPNLTGWYSYKIVVKQTDQDYYNVYLPGIVNGSLNTDGLNSTTTASISLFADNINKVPKDLSTVGPSQTNYNSTENLTLRVNNTIGFSSVQFYPGTDIEKVTQISELTDLGISLTKISKDVKAYVAAATTFTYEGSFDENIQPGMAMTVVDASGVTQISLADGFYVLASYSNGTDPEVKLNAAPSTVYLINANDTVTFNPPGVVYNAGNNPLIGIMSTSTQIGVSEQSGFKTQLAVAETTPFESLLDIYYETTSTGSISVLNRAILDGIPVSVPIKSSNISFNLSESQTGSVACTNTFTLLDSSNTPIINANVEGEIVKVLDKNNNNRTTEFSISDDSNGTFSISTTNDPGKGYYIKQSENDTTFDFELLMTNDKYSIPIQFEGKINNERPVYQGTSGNDGDVTVAKTGQTFGRPSDGDFFECFNGSGDTSLNTKEVQWEIISAIVTDGKAKAEPNSYGGNWPTAYYETEPSNPASFVVWKGQDLTRLFELSVGPLSFGHTFTNSVVKITFAGLQAVGQGFLDAYLNTNAGVSWIAQIFGADNAQFETNVLQTPQLVEFIEFNLTLQAKDRSGSGQVAESNGLDSSIIQIKVRAEN